MNFEKKKKIEFNSEYNCIPNNTQNTNLLINNKTKKDELELKVKSNKNLNHLVETIKSNVSEYTSNLNKESDFNFNSEHKENFVSEEKDKNVIVCENGVVYNKEDSMLKMILSDLYSKRKQYKSTSYQLYEKADYYKKLLAKKKD